MSEVHRIVKQLQRTFRGRAFHGPAVEESLEGVTADVALASSPGGSHNVWQIVEHIIFWQDTATGWLQGKTNRPGPGEDWPSVAGKGEKAWQETLQRLRASNDHLRDEVMVLDESRLEEPTFEGQSKVYVMLHGIIQHNIYHAGQISLLKKIHSARST